MFLGDSFLLPLSSLFAAAGCILFLPTFGVFCHATASVCVCVCARVLCLVMLLLVFVLAACVLHASSSRDVLKSSGPPAFFLQDTTDGMCLAGATFQRCSVDTLWFVVGKPGSYKIHHFSSEEEPDQCLDKLSCHLETSEAGLANCNHCGAKKWNFVGDAQTGN